MRFIVLVLLLSILPAASEAAPLGKRSRARVSSSTSFSLPRGVSSLTGQTNPIDSSVLTNSNVDIISLRTGWNDLAPTATGGNPNYSWTYLDTEAARAAGAGKWILLRVGTGSGAVTESGGNMPDWVMAKVDANSGVTFSFIDTNSGGITRRIPVFWDPTFLAEKRKLIADMGTHFAATPSIMSKIRVIFVGFANAQSSDWSVPDSGSTDGLPPSGSTEVSRWTAAGYTTQKVIDSGCATGNTNGVLDAAVAAFPNAVVAFAGGTTRTALDPAGTRFAAESALANANAKYPNHCILQVNSLSQKSAANQPFSGQPADNVMQLLWDSTQNGFPTAAQMLFSSSNSGFHVPGYAGDRGAALTEAVDSGKEYKTCYQEIYEGDVTALVENLPAAIAHAHTVLITP